MGVASVIGALRVNLGLNSAGFRSGLDQSQQRLAKFGAMADKAFLALGAAALGAAAAMGVMVRGSINTADQLSKLSASTGVAIDELSQLAYAGKYADVPIEKLGTSLVKLAKNMGDVAQGKGADAKRAFDVLGISVTGADGKLRAANDVIYDIADQFAAMPNGVEKTALAVQLFGRSGAELIPLLNTGSAGLRAMADESDRLGFTLDANTGVAAEAFNDRITKLGALFEGISYKIMAAVLPALGRFQEMMIAAAEGGTDFDGVIAGIGRAMTVLVNVAAIVFAHLKDIYDLFKLWVSARIVLFIGSLAGSMLTLARTVRVVGLSMALVTSITRAKITAIVLLAAAIAKLTGTYDALVGWIHEFSGTVMNALPDSVRQGVEDLTGALSGLGGEIETVDGMAADALGGYLTRNEEVIDSFGQVGQSGAKATEIITDGLDAAKDKARSLGESIKGAFQNAGSSLRELLDGTKSWNEALGDVLINLGKMAFSNINFGGPSQGGSNIFGDVIGGLFGGLFGFKDGGAFKVGGTGGIDSQTVAFNASPDEVVSITKPGQGEVGQSMIIHQKFVFDGATSRREFMEMAQAGAAQAVETVKRSVPGWNVELSRNGVIS